ncbi:MAG: hypothetical protein K2K81_11060 [Muribaculaceae bacterium]|nr:hypothetical protein [Muribaculaceae bacterium]
MALLNRIFNLIFIILVFVVFAGCQDDEVFMCKVDSHFQMPDSIIKKDSQYIVLIGDIQEYTSTDDLATYLYKTCDWLRSVQYYYNNLICVLQNGDLTWDNGWPSWKRADHAVEHLGENIVYIPSIGNHDYKWGGKDNVQILDRGSTRLNSNPNICRLKKEKIDFFEEGKLDNIIVPLGGKMNSWNIISLEFGPRAEVIDWADSIVSCNAENRYILMTHEWLTRDGVRINEGSYAEKHFEGQSYSTPQEIWEKMVYPNNNIICVVCGHNGFCKYLFTSNEKGREVCQILFNLQYQKNGGDGMIQLWEFQEDMKKIKISVYNTITRKVYADESTQIEIPI